MVSARACEAAAGLGRQAACPTSASSRHAPRCCTAQAKLLGCFPPDLQTSIKTKRPYDCSSRLRTQTVILAHSLIN